MTSNSQNKPLAERMRPINLDEFIGQEELTGTTGILRNMVESGQIKSMIFWGPPGVGKTTLAQIIAHYTGKTYFQLSAIESGVKEIRAVIDQSKKAGGAILFIDEIHRFSKSQQDSLLGAVEKGIITLIGATTENPSFEVINALLSRCQVYILKEFTADALKAIVQRALNKDNWLISQNVHIKEWESLIRYSGGDGRKILNLLELVVASIAPNGGQKNVTNANIDLILQHKTAHYDKDGAQHYDIISAFIKSMRGSDPNAAVYYLARMIKGGEDPKFIARRMVIFASEDIGNANPNALLLATACFNAVEIIGYPECRINLAQTVTYLASSPKSNAAYMAINIAQDIVNQTGNLSIPLPIRNAPTQLMKELGYGDQYKYAHDYEGNFITQEFMPQELVGEKLYNPGNNSSEAKQRAYLKQCWKDKYGY